MKQELLNYKEIRDRIISEYATTPTAVLAEKYGITTNVVRHIAKRHGIKKDFAAQRAYKQAYKPLTPSDMRKEVIQQLIADYPYYSNVHLANKYHMTRGQINNVAKHYHLHKDFDALRKIRKERQKDILADYSHRSTHEVAAEMGITVEALRKRANRIGIHKTECTARPREKTFKERTVLVYAHDYPVEEIAANTGIKPVTVRAILRRNGITPKAPPPKQVVIQWTLDGQFVARHPSYRSAAMSLGKKYGFPNIQACAIGKEGHKSAYGYRWTIEIL